MSPRLPARPALLVLAPVLVLPVAPSAALGADAPTGPVAHARPTLGADEDAGRNDSGGPLHPEQAAYDALHYDLAVEVHVAERTIDGLLTMRARVVHPTVWLRLDLDAALEVRAVREGDAPRRFEHAGHRLRVHLDRTRQPGEELALTVVYGGTPVEAPRPPWEGGFVWAETPDGRPWVVTANQMNGGDLWWPVKDHPSDEPQTMDIAVTVPAPLFCASNGRFVETVDAGEGRLTHRWHVSTPINTDLVALNIGPYERLDLDYASTSGETFPVHFWVLPQSVEQGRAILPEFLDHLRFLEERFGPYPFRADKYGVVETPHLGMEHQTIIAYGNQFRRDGKWGYDWLHHHELSHEWWGNLVTAADWAEFWIHEGFGTYAQNLYVEHLHGPDAYVVSLRDFRGRILNAKPVAPRGPRTTGEIYFVDLDAPAGELQSDSDIYYKGAWILHTLRWLVGDEAFFRALRRMAYPTPELEATRDGRACRFATTDDFLGVAEKESRLELDWFFEVYLRQPELPRLVHRLEGEQLLLRWETPTGQPFPMPVQVALGDTLHRFEVDTTERRYTVPAVLAETLRIDPRSWLLRVPD